MPREKAQAAPTARPKVLMRRRGADCLVVVRHRLCRPTANETLLSHCRVVGIELRRRVCFFVARFRLWLIITRLGLWLVVTPCLGLVVTLSRAVISRPGGFLLYATLPIVKPASSAAVCGFSSR